MNALTTALLSAFAILLSGCGGKDALSEEIAKSPACALISEINNGQISSATCFLTPDIIETPVSVDEARLSRISSKIIIDLSKDDDNRRKLIRNLAEIRPYQGSMHLDLRFGCVFYNNIGEAVHTLYINKLYNNAPFIGSLDSQLVVLDNGIIDWLRTNQRKNR